MMTNSSNMPIQWRRDFKNLPGFKHLLRGFLLLTLTIFITGATSAQKALKITRMRKVTWDNYNRAWSPWPANWSTYEKGNEPVVTITRLDDSGYQFRIDVQINGQASSFNVSYNGFDDKNNWTKYMDPNGDEIAIVGSTMSNLSQYGWPDTTVQIYFWIYSGSYGLELE